MAREKEKSVALVPLEAKADIVVASGAVAGIFIN